MNRGRPKGRQPYGAQKSGQKSRTKAELREFIATSAGGDGKKLIEDYMKTQDGKVVGNRHLTAWEVLMSESREMIALVKGLQVLAKQAPDYKKRQFVSIIRGAGFTRKQLEAMGVPVGERGPSAQITLIRCFVF